MLDAKTEGAGRRDVSSNISYTSKCVKSFIMRDVSDLIWYLTNLLELKVYLDRNLGEYSYIAFIITRKKYL